MLRAPRYRLHKRTGQAVVTIGGIYLGKYRSAASREAYRRKVAEWMQHGGQLPAPQHTATFTEIVVAYTEFATGYYRKQGETYKVSRHLAGTRHSDSVRPKIARCSLTI